MKGFFKRLPKKAITGVVLGIVTIAGLGAISAALLGGDRPVRPYQGPGTPGFDKVVFNSFTDVPNIGDERDFFTGKISQAPNGFYDPMNGVRGGDEVLMRVYVHNNADPKYNADGSGVAKNTRVRVALPTGLSQNQVAQAYISADNAQPQIIEDTLTMNGEYPVQLQYVAGSATIKTNQQDRALSDDVVNGGVLVGDDNINGTMRGCFEYVALVTFKVKIVAPSYSLTKQVSMADQANGSWQKTLEAKSGDSVSWMMTFKNVGTTELKNVKIVDEVPAGVEVVPGTVKLINGNYPNGHVYPANAVQANGRQVNVDIGNYNPGGVAYVGFRTKVSAISEKDCKDKSIVNKAFATPTGFGSISDTATVNVKNTNDCKPSEKPTYECTLITVEKTEGRKVKVTVKPTMSGNAKVKNYVYDFGDGSAAFVTDKNPVSHEYATDGTYKIGVKINFSVDGQDKNNVTSDNCAQMVTFTSGKPVTPTTPTTPTELPNTGAGDLVAIFAATSIGGALAYYVFMSRRFARDV